LVILQRERRVARVVRRNLDSPEEPEAPEVMTQEPEELVAPEVMVEQVEQRSKLIPIRVF
tara:strand:+ start:518 stop:697 length:180 start_codon:yes stop_codon:yes gene_type:complete